MLKGKRGVSIISLVLCAVAITFVTTALVVATNNSAEYRVARIMKRQNAIVDSSAYVKVYSLNEVENVARQAFVDNYLSYYNGEVTLLGFEALVLGQIQETIPVNQLDNFIVYVTADGVDVVNR